MLIDLPFELQRYISAYLTPKDILSIRLTCKYLSNFDNFEFLYYKFLYYIKTGHIEEINKLLYNKNINPMAFKNLALREAVFRSHHDVVELLLQNKKSDVDALKQIVVFIAIANKDDKMLQILYKYTKINMPKFIVKSSKTLFFIIWII